MWLVTITEKRFDDYTTTEFNTREQAVQFIIDRVNYEKSEARYADDLQIDDLDLVQSGDSDTVTLTLGSNQLTYTISEK